MTRFPGVVDLRVSIFILPVIVRASPISRHLGRWPGAIFDNSISHKPSTHLCRTHGRVLSSLVSIPDQSFRCEVSVVPFRGAQTGGVLCKSLPLHCQNLLWRAPGRAVASRSSHSCLSTVMSGIVNVFVVSPDTRSERRFDLHITVQQLKVCGFAISVRSTEDVGLKASHNRTSSSW